MAYFKQNYCKILILLFLSFGIGSYLIYTTVLISPDGVEYLETARSFQTDWNKTLRNCKMQPAFPVSVSIVSHGLFWRERVSNESLVLSGQLVSLFFRSVAIVVLFLIGKQILFSIKSFWACVLLIVIPNPAKYGVDALTEWIYLAFLFSSLLFFLIAFRKERSLFYFLSGVFCGLAYLAREEGLIVIVFGILTLFLFKFYESKSKKIKWATAEYAFLLIVGVLITASPYMLLRRCVLPEHNIGSFKDKAIGQAEQDEEMKEMAVGLEVGTFFYRLFKGIPSIFFSICKTVRYILIPFIITGFIWEFKRSGNRKIFRILLFFIAVYLSVLLFAGKSPYLNQRHALPLVCILLLFVPSGFLLFSDRIAKCTKNPKDMKIFFGIFLSVCMIFYAFRLFRPLNYDKKHYVQACMWVNKNISENSYIAVDDPRLGFYANRKYFMWHIKFPPQKADYMIAVFENDLELQNYLKRHQGALSLLHQWNAKTVVALFQWQIQDSEKKNGYQPFLEIRTGSVRRRI